MEYNLFERTIEKNGIVNYCNSNINTLLAYSPLDQGQMNAISPQKKSKLEEIAKKHNKSIQQIILNFIISQKQIVAIVRTTSKKHLKENIKAMSFKLTKKDIELIN